MSSYTGTHVSSASKHAVRVLTEGLRIELRDLKSNIRVTVSGRFIYFYTALYGIVVRAPDSAPRGPRFES
jgi:NAD(P)-dependent dehydrogenase (short-subunit alcohol dehydrogenase family)